jgi:hypothetical protein
MYYKLKDYIAISGSGVLFNTQTGESYSVNEIGMLIIEMIKNNRSLDEIRESIYSSYQIDEETLDKHLDEFLVFMKSRDLVFLNPSA